MKPSNLSRVVDETANRILERDPDPVVHYRLLRDVLGYPPGSGILEQARGRAQKSCWIQELEAEQETGGSPIVKNTT